jgi:hypothetical protein
MKPLTILIEEHSDYALPPAESKYTLQTMLTIAGIPWHFLPPGSSKTPDLYLGRDRSRPCKLFIEMSSISKDDLKLPHGHLVEDGIVFLLFSHGSYSQPFLHRADGQIRQIFNDIVLTGYYLLTGQQEKFLPRDSKDRHAVQQSFLFRYKLLATPIINQYGLLFRNIFKSTHTFRPPWPEQKQYAVALSHDVDYPEMNRPIEALRYLASHRLQSRLAKIGDILQKRETFWKFMDWLELEQRYQVKSSFYFCGFQGSLLRYLFKTPDPFYDVGQKPYREIISQIDSRGFEVGMHSSYLAYRSLEQSLWEKQRVEESLGKPVWGNRQHYWHLNPNNPGETAIIHHKIGLLYDSSISYAKHSGFRYSICSPFHFYDPAARKPVPTLQLPPTLMDNHLFGYNNYANFPTYQSHIDALLEAVRTHEGVVVVDYHVRTLNSTFYPGWKESYEYLLERITSCPDFYCDIPLNIAKYWLQREQEIEGISRDEYCNLD